MRTHERPASSKAQRALAKTLEFADTAAARSALAQGARVDNAHGDRIGLLMRASSKLIDKNYLALLATSSGSDSRDAYERTALHHACSSGRAENANILLEAGLSADARDNMGLTPFAAALTSCHWRCALMLETKEALLATDGLGRRGFHVAQEAFARSSKTIPLDLRPMVDALLLRGFALAEELDIQEGLDQLGPIHGSPNRSRL